MPLIPYKIETLYQRHPFSNWLIIAACIAAYAAQAMEAIPENILAAMVLQDWNPVGLAGHIFLHADLLHLLGNMLFLWVFGNAICSNTSNFIYPILFILLGVTAAQIHLLMDGSPAVGASGAINGIIGLTLAMYPINRVHVFWILGFRGGDTDFPVWGLATFWFVFDLMGVVLSSEGVAYWAHIGGLIGGIGMGLIALHFKWVELTEFDNRSLLQILKREHPNH
jgi:membrane associated rhomboid family serine protease